MEHQKYRLVMGIISVLLSVCAFMTALAACILYCVLVEDYLKLLFLPLLIFSSIATVITAIFSTINIGSKPGIASFVISLAGAVCLIIAYTQL